MRTDVLRSTLAGTPVAPVLRVLDCITIAGELLAEAFPGRVGEPEGLFMLLQPPLALQGKADALYRAHAKELIQRAAAGEDTRLATRAEVLVGLLGTSLRAPLRTEAQACAERLFNEVFPGVVACSAREAWSGQVEQDIAEAQRKLQEPSRVLRSARKAA
ncbi:MAG: hypothetical protein SFW67_17550 [Myxococcaceae bacterium]|nr:hypothetical protein [Myxococcaceae bacterium]